MGQPSFLDLPDREVRPRGCGLTHVLDKGLSIDATTDFIAHVGHLVDIVKIGWGIAYVDPTVTARVELYRAAGIDVSLGGTLIEVCAAQGRVDELRTWAHDIGVNVLEVSNGLCRLDRSTKSALIRELSTEFRVAAEVGAKDSAIPVVLDEWLTDMEADLEAGAQWLVTEGRESGTVGIYNGNGTVRDDMIEAISERLPIQRVIFEAPNKSQQVWFITNCGPGVNLGNIAPEEVLPLETLRLGLRADTALHPSTNGGAADRMGQ